MKFFFNQGMFAISKEDYENVQHALAKVIVKLMNIKNILIDEINYDVVWFLGADLKMLAILYGLNAANSYHACIV